MLNATLTKKIEVTDSLIISHVKPDAEIPDFRAGQYVALGLSADLPRPANFPPERKPPPPGTLIRRAYSIASSPEERDHLEFCIAVVLEGSLTSRLTLLQPGDRMRAEPKITGMFTLEGTPEDANLVLVATGTGIAPYMSMLRTPSTWTAGRKISLIHGVRYAQDLAYRDEIEQFSQTRADFSYHPVVSRGDGAWKGRRGHVQQIFQNGDFALDAAKDHVFLCGNPQMIDETEALLTPNGYRLHSRKTPGNLHLERYW
jgi:ferredoxin--NADP+ reductase